MKKNENNYSETIPELKEWIQLFRQQTEMNNIKIKPSRFVRGSWTSF